MVSWARISADEAPAMNWYWPGSTTKGMACGDDLLMPSRYPPKFRTARTIFRTSAAEGWPGAAATSR